MESIEFEDNNTSRKSYTKTKIKLNDDRSHIMAVTQTTTDGNHKELRSITTNYVHDLDANFINLVKSLELYSPEKTHLSKRV